MDGHAIGATVMMQLGTFQFSIDTAAYQDLTRSASYRWGSQDRFGQSPALQFTGYESETIALNGVIFPEFAGGWGQLDDLRALAAEGLPQMLITGMGEILDEWVIESVEEKQTVFAAGGVARKIEFSLKLRKFE